MWIDCAPPLAAESACTATRTTLFSGCWAVSVDPPVCAWKRSACARGLVAPKRSRMISRPQTPGGAELRHLLEEVVVRVEEEGEPSTELIRREARLDGRLAVGNPVRKGESKLLHGGRAGLANVVAGDRDRVPARNPLVAIREEIGRDPHRRPRREDVVPARDVLLQDVVLGRPAKRLGRYALALGHQLVQEEQERCRRVDGHGRRDLAERDVREEELHVRDRVDGDSGPPHLPERMRIVRVVAELGRKVESDREARLPPLEQVAEPLVRLFGGCEPRVLADRPRPAPVHVRVGPARERELPGRLELESRNVRGGVDRLDLDARVRFAPVLLDGHQLERLPPSPRVGCLRAGGRQALRRPARAGGHGGTGGRACRRRNGGRRLGVAP